MISDATGNIPDLTMYNFALNGSSSNWISKPLINGDPTVTTCPEIMVSGNGTEIVSGSTGTSFTDHTRFDTTLTTGSSSRVFSITNSSPGRLTIDSNVVISGTHASAFTLISIPHYQVDSGTAGTSFEIEFIPTDQQEHSATVTVYNTDCDEATYTFNISGYGLKPDCPNVPSSVVINSADTVILCGQNVEAFVDTSLFSKYNGISYSWEWSIDSGQTWQNLAGPHKKPGLNNLK